MPPAPERQLARLRARYAQHAVDLSQLGFMLKGSVVRRVLPCGNPGCRCHGKPPHWHGPYWQWTSKVRGKTVTRMLREEQVRRYQTWIAHRKRFEQLAEAMHELSVQADALVRRQEQAARTEQDAPRRRLRSGKAAARR